MEFCTCRNIITYRQAHRSYKGRDKCTLRGVSIDDLYSASACFSSVQESSAARKLVETLMLPARTVMDMASLILLTMLFI
jgi:hypothetical protein